MTCSESSGYSHEYTPNQNLSVCVFCVCSWTVCFNVSHQPAQCQSLCKWWINMRRMKQMRKLFSLLLEGSPIVLVRSLTAHCGSSLVVQWVKNLPSNARDMGSIPEWGTKILRASEQLSPPATTTEPTYSATWAPQLERNPCTAMKSPQLRPNAAKNK